MRIWKTVASLWFWRTRATSSTVGSPAEPRNDGKQTPYRGHPVFVAQHATATCCRGCLAKWHGIPQGRALDEADKACILAVMERWLAGQLPREEQCGQSRIGATPTCGITNGAPFAGVALVRTGQP